MAIDTSSMMLKLNPLSPIDIGGFAQAQSARENLRLAREKFEAEKRRAEEERELRRLEEEGRNARERLIAQREADKAQATREAATLAARRAAQTTFSDQVAKRDFEGAEAFIPQLEMLGGGVDITRSPSGFPSYRVHDDAKRDAGLEAQNQDRHWETAKRELDQGVYPGQEEKLGAPLAPADPITGHVLDTGAMQQQTLQRLSPYLESQVASYPEGPYQDSAQRSREGVEALGLSAADSATRFRADRAGVDSAIKDTLDADEAAQPKEMDEMQHSTLRQRGESGAHDTYKDQKVPEALEARKNGLMLLEMFDKKDPRLAQLVGPAIMAVAGVKGAQSDRDLAETLGASRQTYLDQGIDWFRQRFLEGGFSPEQTKAFRDWIEEGVDQSSMQAFGFMDTARGRINSGDEHEDERTGWRNFLLRMPPDIREEYELYRHDAGDDEAEGDVIGSPRGGSAQYDPDDVAPSGGGEFDEELEAMAMESDLDPEKIRRVMGPESGGSASARNPESGATGLIQFLPSVARKLGTTTEELAEMSASEQLPYVMKYFSEWGVTSDSPQSDYLLAVAAPAFIGRPPHAIVYRKGTKAWEQNPGWRPADGGDITVGSIQAFYGDKSGEAPAPAAKARTKEDQAALDLMR
jgi:hypothetical protein